MDFLIILLTILSMFIFIVILDYIWLGIITKKFIIKQFGRLVKVVNGSIQIKLWAGILTWLIIAVGCYIFVVLSSISYSQALIFGSIFGFIAYAIYDLTNLTFIVNYPVKFVSVDIAWGTVLCATTSVFGFFIQNMISKII